MLCWIPLLCASPPRGSAQEGAPLAPTARHEIALDLGLLAGARSYAHSPGVGPVGVGAGVWGAWEPRSTFDRNVWEPLGIELFARHWPRPWLHVEVGATGARYLWADDCSDCSGTFVGGQSAAFVGWRGVFIGPEMSIGRASDREHGSELGVIWGVRARLLRGWER